MNNVNLLGRLTKDVELRDAGNNKVANFTLAVNRRFKQEGQPDADFINIVAWGKTAEFCEKYFQKGSQIAIVGRIQVRSYDDKDGKKVYVTEVVAESCYFAGSKVAENEQKAADFQQVEDTSLPF